MLRIEPAKDKARRGWRLAALAFLSVRFVQGWIYWGGGSRRIIYAPEKLDPHAHWLAYKFQSAMPGALLGIDHLIAFLLQHFELLYVTLVGFSAAELVFGLMLLTGLLTRLAAAVTIVLSVLLMLAFGWQGATCIDEWTMAASTTAMGIALILAGAGAWSLDRALSQRFPSLAERSWFRWLGGAQPLPLSERAFEVLALVLTACVIGFVVATYSYYRGSVVTAFHSGPVSPSVHHLSLQDGQLLANGSVRFHVYVDGGTEAVPAHIMVISLGAPDGKVVQHWGEQMLAALPTAAFHNDFDYRKIELGRFGITAPVGAAATITLPPGQGGVKDTSPLELQVVDVSGKTFQLRLSGPVLGGSQSKKGDG
jgi:thiosulfate dehydrogenase [quinone] large subunit